MGGSYLIAGRNVSSHYLAITTLATVGLGAFAISKRIKSKKPNTPPINASSADEEAFIKEFLKHAEEEEKKK
ncbi:unnamed protein product [Rhizophagus irregularis]|uniref:ATP synthase subunit K, mitochondrial n=1 Tax=Rhizophagus irregularis TaxID=588596 RepID=A0A2I1FSN8_9GLOM|nr:hypothetical protein RhiirA4_390366 [Rhizophagus irregularis]CAB4403922.1 unnamed protein product [Rhizophagus irregularis]